MHEQSETVQLPNGRWALIYGRNTPRAGDRLESIDYPDQTTADRAAVKRSDSMTPYDELPDVGQGASGSNRSPYDDLPDVGTPAPSPRPAEVVPPRIRTEAPSPTMADSARTRVTGRINFGMGEAAAAEPTQESLGARVDRALREAILPSPAAPASVTDLGFGQKVRGRILYPEVTPIKATRPVPEGQPVRPDVRPTPPGQSIVTGGEGRLAALADVPRVVGNALVSGGAGITRAAGELLQDVGTGRDEQVGQTMANAAAAVNRRIAAENAAADARFAPIVKDVNPTIDRLPGKLAEWITGAENIHNVAQQGPQLLGIAGSLLGLPTGATLLGTIGLPVLGQSYDQYREMGIDPPLALLGAAGQMGTEVIPEYAWIKFARSYKLADLKGITALPPAMQAQVLGGLMKQYGVIGLSEQGQEMTSTIGNWIVDYAMKDPSATLERLGQDLKETFRQVALFAPVMAGSAHVGHAAMERAMGPAPDTMAGRTQVFANELAKAVQDTELPSSGPIVPRGTITSANIATDTTPQAVQPAGTEAPTIANAARQYIPATPVASPQQAVEEQGQPTAAEESLTPAERDIYDRVEPGTEEPPTARAIRQELEHPTQQRPVAPALQRSDEEVAARVQETEKTPVTAAAPEEVPPGMQRSARLLGEATGRRVVFVKADPAAYEGSHYEDDPRTVVVNINSDRSIRRLLGHETLHTLRRTNPEIYNQLSRAMAGAINTRLAAQRYGRVYTDLSTPDRVEEMVADLRGDMMDDPKFWLDVFHRSKGPLVKRIVTLVSNLWDTLLHKLTGAGKRLGYQSADLITDLKRARAALATAHAQFEQDQSARPSEKKAPVNKIEAGRESEERLEQGTEALRDSLSEDVADQLDENISLHVLPRAEQRKLKRNIMAALTGETGHRHSETGPRTPIPDHLVRAIENEVTRMGGVADRKGAADVSDRMAKQHGRELVGMIDKLPPGKRPMMLLHDGDKAKGIPTVWLLGWSTKEGTDVHDHVDSQVGVSVIRGTVKERVFGVQKGLLAREAAKEGTGVDAFVHERDLRAGSTVALAAPYVHEVFGSTEDQAKRDVTVHAYYPPLKKMTYFRYNEDTGKLLYDGEWDEANPPAEGTRKSAVGERRASGELVGGFGAKSASAAVNRMTALAKKGLSAKDWYKESAAAILNAFNGDKAQAERFVQVIAITSAHQEVKANFTTASKALDQYAAGQPIHVGTGITDKALSDLLYHGREWSGKKTNDFYHNIMQYISGEEVNRPVQDRYQMRMASGDESRITGTARQYEFAADITRRVAEKLKLTPDQAQAAMWVAKKAQTLALANKESKRTSKSSKYAGMTDAEIEKAATQQAAVSYASEIERRNWKPPAGLGFPGLAAVREAHQLLTAEVRPSTSTELGKEAAGLNTVQLREFQEGALDAIGGEKSFFNLFGLDSTKVTSFEGTGAYENKISPNLVAAVNASKDVVDHLAKGWMYVFKQDAVPYFKAQTALTEDPNATRGVFVTVEAATDAKERAFYKYLTEKVDPGIGYTRDGNTFMVMNFHGQPVNDFLQKMDAALTSPDNPLKVTEAVDYGAHSTYPTHDWAQDPEGKTLLDQASAGQPPSVREGLRSRANAFEQYAREALGPGRSEVQAGSGRGAATAGANGRRLSAPGPRSWNVDDPGLGDALIREWQDNKVDLRRVEEAIRSAAGVVPSGYLPSLSEKLSYGRITARTEKFVREKVEPFLHQIHLSGLSIDDFGLYLWARHAPERNAQIARINPTMQGPGSGMSDADAKKAIQVLRARSTNTGALDRAVAMHDGIVDDSRRALVDNNLEDQSTIDNWMRVYKHYTPLQRTEDQPYTGQGKGFKVMGPSSKRAMGSGRAAIAIVANVIAQHEAIIQRVEHALVGRDLIKLAEEFPNDDFWRVDQPPTKRTINPTTGLVQNGIDPSYRTREDVLIVKDRDPTTGKVRERVLTFNAQNERARRLSRAMQNLDAVQAGAVTKIAGVASRYVANLATQWNPLFWSTNFLRDVQTAAVNLQSTPLSGKAPQVLVRIPQAMAGIFNAEYGKGNTAWAKYYREYEMAGGKTGWKTMFDSMLDRQAELAHIIERSGRSKLNPKEIARWTVDQFSTVNSAIENGTRLAAYVVARKEGMSEREAAILAKELTVNFNTKGNRSSATNMWWVFFNANVQGTMRLLSGAAKSNKVKALLASYMAFGAMMDLVNWLIGSANPDDAGNNPYELIDNSVKQRNWILMRPGRDEHGNARKWSFPMAYGMNFFPNLGRILMEAVRGGALKYAQEKRSAGELGMDVASSAIDAFVPFGNATTPLQYISPTIADPVVQIYENKTWWGGPLVPKREDNNKRLPPSELYFSSNTDFAKDLAREINDMTGGNEIIPGKISIYPGYIDHVIRTMSGGLGTFKVGLFDWGRNVAERMGGEDVESLPWRRVPFVGKFYGEIDERDIESKYYRIKEKADEVYAQYKASRKAGEFEQADRLQEEHPGLIEFAKEIERTRFRRDLRDLRQEQRDTRDIPSKLEREKARTQIKRDQAELYNSALDAYNSAQDTRKP